jgi:hypothetical protein
MYVDLMLFFCVSMTLAVRLHSVSVIPLSSATLAVQTDHAYSQPPSHPATAAAHVRRSSVILLRVYDAGGVWLHSVSVIPLSATLTA